MARGVRDPSQGRRPTPMLPPTAVVAAQLDALQINDWRAPGCPCLVCTIPSRDRPNAT